jgi:hypothetical protein
MTDKLTLENYYEILKTKFKLAHELRRHYGKILSPEFNSFDFWWLDENKVSDILAFFINPKETHAQGDIFLKEFLQTIGEDIDCDKFTVEVIREQLTNENRRIDIVISFNKGEYIIGIENKIYETTTDQEKQLEHYWEYLKRKSNNKFRLFYLAPINKIISEHSLPELQRKSLEENGQFKKISYEEHIIDCIHRFSINSESERVRAFLSDFEKSLKQLYIGEKFMDENNLIVDFATSNLQNLETTLKIGFTISEVKKILKDKLYNQCEKIAKDFGLKSDFEFYDSFRIYPKQWNNHSICFSFESGGLKYGICRNTWDKDKTRKNEIEEMLGGSWNVSNWFLCENFLYRNFENDTDGWLDIEKGVLATKVYDFVKSVIENKKLNSKDL